MEGLNQARKVVKCEAGWKQTRSEAPTTQSTKVLRKVAKQKLSEIEKRNILKSIGVEKPKKLQKYLKWLYPFFIPTLTA